jgi:RNA polymerase sigma factor (sigma-70 family)
MVPMTDDDWLAARFEANRPRLRGVAYRMLGSLAEAEDAVQEAWIRAAGGHPEQVANLDGWLTTVVARICLDMLRSRKSRREEPLDAGQAAAAAAAGPEQEAELADSVGYALLVVLDTLAPAERVAFVLHDMFGLPFEEIGTVTGRTPVAARQLASRARRRVQGPAPVPDKRRDEAREVAAAFLSAARGGDLEGLLAVLDPDVVLHGDAASVPPGMTDTLVGASAVSRGAVLAGMRARYSGIALIDGNPGIVMAPQGRLVLVLVFTVPHDKITHIEIVSDPEHLARMELAVL